MFQTIKVTLDQRAVVLRDGLPVKALGPGRHTFWGGDVTVRRFATDALLLDAPAALRALLPGDWVREVTVGPRQRAVVYADERPRRYLTPGVHRVWTVDPSVRVAVYDLDGPAPALDDDLRAVVPATDLIDVTVRQYQRGLKYVQGRFDAVLPPGRYAFWSDREARVEVTLLDTRSQLVTVANQELMTRDKVSLRLSLTVEYAPSDLATTVHAVADLRGSLYLMVQLAARDYVAGVTLDELLEGRDAMNTYLADAVGPEATAIGVAIKRVGVKDILLPGDMKALLNRVIAAEKEAASAAILRRQEAADTRQMAQVAKVMADNPSLLRLKELDALKDVARQVDELRVVLGGGLDAALKADKLLASD